jgi:Fe-S-cluster containining protein
MSYLITKEELLELRDILKSNEGENECIACGLCCKISGKFFIKLEQERLSKKYSNKLFSKDHEIDVIQTTDFIPWCVGGSNQNTIENLNINESKIIKPDIIVEEIILQPWFYDIKCQVYIERPILCRFYPYNSFPHYCMIGIEFFGENSRHVGRFKELMAKYIYSYRWECFQAVNFSFKDFKVKSSDQIIYKRRNNIGEFIIKHQKGLMEQNSIWNIWGYLGELSITTEEKQLILSFDGSKSLEEIIDHSKNPSIYASWRDLIINYLIFELIEYPEEFLKVLLLGIVRF